MESNKYVEFMDELFELTVKQKGSDLHLKADANPLIRIDGELVPQEDYPVLASENIEALIYSILTQEQKDAFENQLELDFSYVVKDNLRFRGNLVKERGNIGAVFRVIPVDIPTLEELNLPSQLHDISLTRRGLVLVTGPTGSGKSTTMAAMLNIINENRKSNIVTIEDPIEFIHTNKKSVIKQREVRSDTLSFNDALKHVLRHDPDVILIGEMRDPESIAIALTAAETGHLVLSSLHTQTAPSTINRIIDVFPEGQKNQIRQQLALTLQAVISQQLIMSATGSGRVVAVELLTATAAIRHQIRDAKEHQIQSTMETSKASGMITMDNALLKLMREGKISQKSAYDYCIDKQNFEKRLMAS
jgi:twitching motility protein PilT